MAPAMQLRTALLWEPGRLLVSVGQPGARETQAARRHGHFGLKPASHGFAVGTPKGSDFRPGKEGDTK